MLKGTRTAIVRRLQPVSVHGQVSLDVFWVDPDDPEEEIVANTAHFTKLIEEYVRRYPDQWLWVHRRWKTRPPGEPSLYSC